MDESENISVRVKTLDGAEHVISISRTSPISRLKTLIEEKTGIPPGGQRIIFQGRMLTDELALNSAGVKDQSVIHCVERAPPAGPGQSSPAAAGNVSGNVPTSSNPDENVRENRNRNRVRNQMERHVQQFVQSLALLGDQADQSVAGNEATHNATESDMESFARQLSGMADALEHLPSHIRRLADQVRSDPASPAVPLNDTLRNAATVFSRLGTAATTIANVQVALNSPPPRRLENSRRVPASLRDFASGAATQGLVVPIGISGNGNIQAGPVQPVSDFGNVIQNAMGTIGAQITTNLANLATNLNQSGTPGPGNNATSGTGFASSLAGMVSQAAQSAAAQAVLNQTQDGATEQGNEPATGSGNRNEREHAATLSASVVSMLSRPTDIDGNPTDPEIERIDGINASITINAQVSPNITIRIVPESSSQSQSTTTPTPAATDSNGEYHRSSPEDVSNRAVGLAPEIISQIQESVNNNSRTGEPIVIECENTNTNSEIGRVIGEAVTQTFQNLSQQITGSANREAEQEETTETTETTTTVTTTTEDNADGERTEMTSETRQTRQTTLNGQTTHRQVDSISFSHEQMRQPILSYLGTNLESVSPMLRPIIDLMNQITLGDIVQVFDGEAAPRSLVPLCQKIVAFATFMEIGLRPLFDKFFKDAPVAKEVDIIESNLSLMRHFMRELPSSVQNAIDLGRLIKLFCLKWIKLNAEVLRGGQTSLSTLLERELVKNEHARTSERTAIKIALEKSTQIVIDGYVMDVKKPEEKEDKKTEVKPKPELKPKEKTEEEKTQTNRLSSSSIPSSSTSSVPAAWRSVIESDRRKINAAVENGPRTLSSPYRAGMPKKI